MSFFSYEMIYVEYCLLQQYGLKNYYTFKVNTRNMCCFAPIPPTSDMCIFFLLLWELGRAQSHTGKVFSLPSALGLEGIS